MSERENTDAKAGELTLSPWLADALARKDAKALAAENDALRLAFAEHEQTVQSQRAAIADLTARLAKAEREREQAVEAIAAAVDDYQTSEDHHPHHVLITLLAFDQLRTLHQQLTGDGK